MSNRDDQSMVRSTLPRQVRRPRSRFDVAAQLPDAIVDRAIAHLHALENAGDREGETTAATDVRVFKRSERKIVFAYDVPEAGRTFVAKVAWMHTLRRMMKYKAFALNEAANLIRAAQLGLPVTQVAAVGLIRNWFGLPKRTVLIIDCLEGYQPIDAALQSAKVEERERILWSVLPLFESLYRTGCQHIDPNAGNVMVSTQQLDKPMLLDFLNAEFHAKPSAEVLMFEAGWFARFIIDIVGSAATYRWLDALLDRTGLRNDAAKWRARFDHFRSSDWSRAERRAVRP